MPLDAKQMRGFVPSDKAGHGDGTRVAHSTEVYTSHFATCPGAAAHRHAKGGAP